MVVCETCRNDKFVQGKSVTKDGITQKYYTCKCCGAKYKVEVCNGVAHILYKVEKKKKNTQTLQAFCNQLKIDEKPKIKIKLNFPKITFDGTRAEYDAILEKLRRGE